MDSPRENVIESDKIEAKLDLVPGKKVNLITPRGVRN